MSRLRLIKSLACGVLLSTLALSNTAQAVYPIIDKNGNKTYEKMVDEDGVEWLIIDKRPDSTTMLLASTLRKTPDDKRSVWARILYKNPVVYSSIPVKVTEARSLIVYDCLHGSYAPTGTIAKGVNGSDYSSLRGLTQEEEVKAYSLPVQGDSKGAKTLLAICEM